MTGVHADTRRVRVLRIIARLNVGGPAHHVTLLGADLDASRYESLLVTGEVGPGEGSFDNLARRRGAKTMTVRSLGPELSLARDALALYKLFRIVRDVRPHIVHTHTAKAGTLGRIAARAALGPRPIVIHTYHGHVLTGYFGPAKSTAFRWIEKALARTSDCLVGVSSAVVEELVALGVAAPEKFRVVPVGLELDRFLAVSTGHGESVRAELGVKPGETLAVFIGRLVAIKRVDLLLDALASALGQGAQLRLAVVGDGEQRRELEARAATLGLTEVVHFLGFRDDLDRVAAAADLAVLSSDNEGTPVALIEAAAAGRPAVATDVGGVADIVTPATGRLVPKGDREGLAAALTELALHPALRARLGVAAREHVRSTYSAARLVSDVDMLYGELLASRRR